MENTGVSVFLTGKAGTGKTTFLKELRRRSPKRMIVVAPTGVAAINAGGVTIHSFFQLPLTPYLPDVNVASNEGEKRYYKFSNEKRNIIRTLDLLVIDEISMVRSDLLDAIDNVLRKYRDPFQPFGGVQLLMIGDLQQLAPVVTANEEALLGQYYDTPFFFGSRALQQITYVTVELKQVFRQRDTSFVDALNEIRAGELNKNVIDLLNSRYDPAFHPRPDEGYIRLTTHNVRATRYNEDELAKLPAPPHTYKATIEGNFPEYSYPTEHELTLKVGAQVMFVKNDPSGQHLFYNGRIGQVTSLDSNHISVHCIGDDKAIDVQPMEWENTRYSINADTKEIEEVVDGVFKQFPLRLAWAITIHKSQGLTFDRAIIDANASFAHGQVYVALSRCKTLEGVVLASPIGERSIIRDDAVSLYISDQTDRARQSVDQLSTLKEEYYVHLLRELFDFTAIKKSEELLCRVIDEHFYRTYPQLLAQHKAALAAFPEKVEQVAQKFTALLSSMQPVQLHTGAFLDRVCRGSEYFSRALSETLIALLRQTRVETDNKVLQRRFKEAYINALTVCNTKNQVLIQTAAHGFSTATYLKDKEKAILDALDEKMPKKTSRSRSSRTTAGGTPTSATNGSTLTTNISSMTRDIKYPELYDLLVAWRHQKSTSLGIADYVIMQHNALICLVNYLPSNISELIATPYFGKVRADKYGADILRIINDYVSKHHIERPQPLLKETLKPKKPKVERVDTKLQTYQMYQDGKTPQEIAVERDLALTTVYGHLSHYVETGDLPLTDFVSADKARVIRQAITQLGTRGDMVNTLKESLGNAYTYTDIRFVMATMHLYRK